MNGMLIISCFMIVAGVILIIIGAANSSLTAGMELEKGTQTAFKICGIILTILGIASFIIQFFRLVIICDLKSLQYAIELKSILKDQVREKEKMAKLAAAHEQNEKRKSIYRRDISVVGYY